MDLFTLAAKLQLDSKGFEQGIKGAEKSGKGFADKLERGLGKITKGVKTATKAMTVGFGAAVAATVPIIKKAVSAYANYEQLVGGVETLFHEASVFVIQDAKEAYRTAGISANQYMEMSTSFAASLMAGLNNDSVAAADAAKKAIIDMSDNANKMGTDIESIQNAYRGFSKQNFTMLDNLKLGYGGTKTEMERLLKDAEKLTGQKYDISNFADIVDAIHEIQVNMGVAGTTAKEAATTISGSWGMVKASWQDMLVAMADPKGNIKKATQNLVESGKTMLSNVLPTIKQAITGLGEFIEEVAPMIGEYLPELISDFLPKFLQAGAKLATGLWKGIKKAWKKINWGQLATGIRTTLGEMLGLKAEDSSLLNIIKAAVGKVKAFVENAENWGRVQLAELLGLDDSASWGNIVVTGARNIQTAINNSFEWSRKTLSELLGLDDSASWGQIAAAGAVQISNYVKNPLHWAHDGLSKLLQLDDTASWDQIVNRGAAKIREGFESVKSFLKTGLASVLGLVDEDGNVDESWTSIGSGLMEKIAGGITAKIGLIRSTIAGLFNLDENATWGDIAGAILDEMSNEIGDFSQLISGFFTSLGEWSRDLANSGKIQEALNGIITGIGNALPNLGEKVADASGNLLRGLLNLVTDAIQIVGEFLLDPKTWANIGTFILQSIEAIGTVFYDGLVFPIVEWFGSIFGGIWDEFKKSVVDPINSFVVAVFQDPYGTIVKPVTEGIKSFFGTVWEQILGVVKNIYNAVVRFFGGDPEWQEKTSKTRALMREYDKAYRAGALDQYVQENFGDNEEAKKTAEAFKKYMDTLYEDAAEVYRSRGYEVNNLADITEAAEDYGDGTYAAILDGIFMGLVNSMTDEQFQAKMDFSESAQASAEEAVKKTQDFLNKTTLEGHINWTSKGGSGNRVSLANFLLDGIEQAMHPHAKGAWNIPYDNYPAALHRGEMVLTASQARRYRDGEGGGSAEIVSAIQSLRQDMQNLQLVVGEKVFGAATVQYGGRKMNGYIGKAEHKTAAGYGWG